MRIFFYLLGAISLGLMAKFSPIQISLFSFEQAPQINVDILVNPSNSSKQEPAKVEQPKISETKIEQPKQTVSSECNYECQRLKEMKSLAKTAEEKGRVEIKQESESDKNQLVKDNIKINTEATFEGGQVIKKH
jgi:hypothetical protein